MAKNKYEYLCFDRETFGTEEELRPIKVFTSFPEIYNFLVANGNCNATDYRTISSNMYRGFKQHILWIERWGYVWMRRESDAN